VQTGVRVAYAAPLISASYSLSSFSASARKNAAVSEDEAAKLVEGTNTLPVAIPGEGFEVEDTDGDGVESVTVDGSASADPDGRIVKYSWSFAGNIVSRTSIATVELPVGTHRLVLTVTDDKGESASARIRIRVKAGPIQEGSPDPEVKTETLPPPPYEVEVNQKNAEIAITWKVEPSVQPPYRVYRTLDDGLKHTEEEIDKFDWLLIREEWEKLSYRDADVQVGVPYFYAVRTFDGTNESVRSNIVGITLQPIADAPTVEAPPADTPTPRVVEKTPTPTVEVAPNTPTPEVVIEDTPTEAPPLPEEDGEGGGA
jgi:hypothetical protein